MKSKTLLLNILLAFLYFSAGKLSYILFVKNGIANLSIFPSEGIALAFVIEFGKRVVPGIFVGQFILAVSNNLSIFSSFGISLVNSLEALIAVWLVKRLKIDKSFLDLRSVFLFFVTVLFILQPFSALFSHIFLYFFENMQSGVFESIFYWWFGNVMGQLLYAPFLLLFFQKYKDINIIYLYFGFFFIIYIYILEAVLSIQNPLLLLVLTMPIMVWAVYRFGTFFGMFLTLLFSFVLSFCAYLNTGIFKSGEDFIVNYNLLILSSIVLVLILGVIFEEKNRYEKRLKDEIFKATQEIKKQQKLIISQQKETLTKELLSMLAHQWRQPLNNLSLLNQIVVSKYEKNLLDDKLMHYFKIHSKAQIENLSKTIDNFRDFFNFDGKKTEFNIKKTVFEVVDMIEQKFSNEGISIKVDIDDGLKFYANPKAFMQVMLNILNNAREKIVKEKIKNGVIEIKGYEKNKDIVLKISDNGGGIDEKIIDKVFDPYFSTKDEKNGVGLGLYISKNIVKEELKGDIFVKNIEGGVEFIIILPGAADEKA